MSAFTMSAFSIFFVACIVVFGSDGLKLPDYITACSRKDPDFNKCALKHGREAIPKFLKGDAKYGVPNLDPIFVKEISMRDFGLTVVARDMTMEGAKNAVLQDISVDFDKLTISLQFLVPLAVFTGKYDMSGKLANLPISGKGDFKVSFVDSIVKYKTLCNLTQHSDGKTYVQPYDYDLAFYPKTGVIHFDNLFNGNKLLGDTMNNFMNENFHLVFEEVAQPAYRALGSIVDQILRGVAEKVPYDELFTD